MSENTKRSKCAQRGHKWERFGKLEICERKRCHVMQTNAPMAATIRNDRDTGGVTHHLVDGWRVTIEPMHDRATVLPPSGLPHVVTLSAAAVALAKQALGR